MTFTFIVEGTRASKSFFILSAIPEEIATQINEGKEFDVPNFTVLEMFLLLNH
jgi:hypothetical protein